MPRTEQPLLAEENSYEHYRVGQRKMRAWLGDPVSTPAGPGDGRPPEGGRGVISTGAASTLIVVGAILRFAVAAGSPHGLNVHVVGVILILAGVVGLLLSLLVRAGRRRPHSLVRQGRGGYYDLPGPRSRLARTKQAAAEDVARVQEDDKFFGDDTPRRAEDDL